MESISRHRSPLPGRWREYARQRFTSQGGDGLTGCQLIRGDAGGQHAGNRRTQHIVHCLRDAIAIGLTRIGNALGVIVRLSGARKRRIGNCRHP